MSDLKSVVKNCKVESVHAVVENGRQKFLCFTRLSEEDSTWFVLASDGADVWRSEFDEDGLDAQRDLVNISTSDAFLTRFKNGFTSGELAVARVGTKLTLTIGKGSSAMDFDLFETKAAERKTELQNVLFRMAEQTLMLETKLSVANQSLEKLRAQKTSTSGMNALMDLGTKKLGSPAKAKPRKTGMSVVNPSSRKRKAATGVVFD
ncbi:protein PAXX-like [Babylonia areolata]|uniref:protein PAXX-like n=1 Tax=Babylonia areolata TaxID=304850 RepID=UPI003FD633C9